MISIEWTDLFNPAQRPLLDKTQKRNRHSCHRRDWNPQSKQGSGRRPTPWTARPPGSPTFLTFTFKNINFLYQRVCGTGKIPLCVISGFCREVDKNCSLLGYYVKSNGNLFTMFRDNLLVPSSGLRILLPAFRDNLLVPSSGLRILLPAFRDKLLVQNSRVKNSKRIIAPLNMGHIGCPETPV